MSKILVLENYLTEADDEGDAGVIVASLKKAAKNGSKKAQDALNKMNKDSKKIAKEIEDIEGVAPENSYGFQRQISFESDVDDKTGGVTVHMLYLHDPHEDEVEYTKEFDSASAALASCDKIADSFGKNGRLNSKGWKKS